MKTKGLILISLAMVLLNSSCGNSPVGIDSSGNLEGKLPVPNLKGKFSVEQAMNERKSVRKFIDKPLSVEQISQLLWAAQGITHSYGERFFRTAPSAGATYPLETYLLTASGVYKYIPKEHSLKRLFDNDLRKQLSEASLGQTAVSNAHAVILFTMIEERTAQRYRDRAYRYVCMEAGHAAQNIHLQAVAMGLGSVPVGAFTDSQVAQILQCAEGEQPLYIVPVGYEAID